MDKVWESGAAASAPPLPTLHVGFPTEGDLASSKPPTNPGAWWFHMITSEILAVIVAAGLTPNGTNLTQLLAALDARYAPGASFTQSLANPGWVKLGPLVIQFGTTSSFNLDSAGNSVTFPITFPTGCLAVVAMASTDNGVTGSGTNYGSGIFNKTTTGFKLNNDASASTFDYIAIGH